jgi:serine protease Do
MGIGFAIPVNMVKTIMGSLIEDGRVIRGWLGIAIQNLDEGLAKSFDYDSTEGVLVGDVSNGSPAAEAGLKAGDIIVAFNGTPVGKADKLRSRVADTRPGSAATLEIYRDGERKEVEVTIGELPSDEHAAKSTSDAAPKLDVGVTVQTLTRDIARQLGYEDGVRGVVVTEVDPFGPAAKAGIRVQDVIMQVQDQKIEDVGDFRTVLRKHRSEEGVRVLVRNGEMQRFAFLKLK